MDSTKPVIFLSASMPKPDRDKEFFEAADFTAIRDAVVGLVNAIIPDFRMVWGGHPDITPIIAKIFEKRGYRDLDLVTLYQSKYFNSVFPEEDKKFSNFVLTDKKGDVKQSLLLMRERMIGENNIAAAVFIGGMEGIKDECNIVKRLKPRAKLFPIASTGGAALVDYEELISKDEKKLYDKLHKDTAYTSLFKELLCNLK